MDFKLIEKVFNWGIDRDLYKYSTVPVQMVKLIEEYSEYRDAIIANDDKAEKDAIGDMLVVAINMYGVYMFKTEGRILTATELVESLKQPSLFMELYTRGGIEEYANLPIREFMKKAIKEVIRNKMHPTVVFYSLFFIFNKPFGKADECLASAYDEIKDRKGKLTADGNFVKEEDYATSSSNKS